MLEKAVLPASPQMGATNGAHVSLAEQAYLKIRRDIVYGRLLPKQALRFEYLKDYYGIGFSPLREALVRLQAERLVTASALRGFRVADLSLEEMWDAINSRILIESTALRSSIAHGDDAWEVRILGAIHALNRLMGRNGDSNSDGVIEQIEMRHHVFHQSLISACQSAWMMNFWEILYVQTERYRYPLLADALHRQKDARDVPREHKDLADAALARDADKACSLLAQHLTKTGKIIEEKGFFRRERSIAKGP